MRFLDGLNWKDPAILAAIVGALSAILFADIRSIVIRITRGLFRVTFGRLGKSKRKDFQWDGKIEFTADGTYYLASEGRPDVLVVLVHGILSNAAGGWPLVAELLQRHVTDWDPRDPDVVRSSDDPLPVRFDLLAFEYPAGLFQRASIGEAAENFSEAFQTGYRDYRNILIVTHSTGGLVVKKALVEDMERVLEALNDDATTIREVLRSSLTLRTRQIVNFAVPHSGGSFAYSLLLFPMYVLLAAILLAALPFYRFLVPRKRGFSFGWNRIGWELRHRRLRKGESGLRSMEQRYRELTTLFDSAILPRPSSVEVSGRSDGVIDKIANDVTDPTASGRRRTQRADLAFVFRGSHPSVRHAHDANDAIIQFLGGFLRRYRRPFDTSVAHATVARTLELDRHEKLISDETFPTKTFPNRRGPGGMQGEVRLLQGDVFNALHEETPRIPAEPPVLVVTGDVGTGKSVALRMFARSLAIQFLNAPDETETLPVFFPLHSIQGVSPKAFKSSLLETWRAFVNDRYLESVDLPKDWLQQRWHRARTIVILDSIDEFLLNRHEAQERITAGAFRQVILELLEEVRGNGRVAFILGIRWGEPILQVLRDDATLILHVRWLSLLEACRYFPRSRPVIESVLVGDLQRQTLTNGIDENEIQECVRTIISHLLNSAVPSEGSCSRPELMAGIKLLIQRQGELSPEQQALSIVRTPLVLNELQRYSTNLEDLLAGGRTAFRFPHQVLDLAITANIKQSRLHVLGQGENHFHIDEWRAALSLAAMGYSVLNAPELTPEEVLQAVIGIEERWRDHEWRSGAEGDRQRLAAAAAIISSADTFGPLLDKTVFFPSGEYKRFKHREWHDYLLGHYFAFALQAANLGEVVQSSFSAKAHMYGGNILLQQGGFAVTLSFTKSVVAQMKKKWGQFVLGNLSALIGKSMIPIAEEALAWLFKPENETAMPLTGKFVLLSALGYRVLRGKPEQRNSGGTVTKDISHAILRETLIAHSNKYILAARASVRPHGIVALLASVGYCYLKALRKIPTDDQAWSGLDLDEQQEEEIIDQLHNEKRDGHFCDKETLEPIYKTCQTAFLTVQYEEYNHIHRGISLVHYLYALTVGFKHDTLISSVRDRLPPLLEADSFLAEEFMKMRRDVPEVWSIFQLCRRLCSLGTPSDGT